MVGIGVLNSRWHILNWFFSGTEFCFALLIGYRSAFDINQLKLKNLCILRNNENCLNRRGSINTYFTAQQRFCPRNIIKRSEYMFFAITKVVLYYIFISLRHEPMKITLSCQNKLFYNGRHNLHIVLKHVLFCTILSFCSKQC